MTIVAGFPGHGMMAEDGKTFVPRGYVVLAADSEASGGLLKSSVQKIALVDKGQWKCLIGGAGDGSFIELAVQEVGQRLSAGLTLTQLREAIEAIVTDIHLKRIKKLKEPGREFELVCALWVQGEGVQLAHIGCQFSLAKSEPESIGSGSPLARYLIATYYTKALPLYHCWRLAVYLLSQVKRHAMYCGGTSQVLWMDDNGTVLPLPDKLIADFERSNAAVMSAGPRGLLYLADPTGWGGDLSQVDKAIDGIGAQVKRNLSDAYPELAPKSIPAAVPIDTPPVTP